MFRPVLLGLVVATLLGVVSARADTGTATTPAPQVVIICVPSSTGAAISPCDVTGQAMMPSVVSGYVLNAADYQSFQASTAPFDAATAAGYFSLGCGVVVSSWLLTFAVGLIFQAVRG